MSPKKLPLAAVLLAASLIAACGQKGPLYLPQEAASPVPAGAVAQPSMSPVGSVAPARQTEAENEQEETRRESDSATAADELEPAVEK